jgi:surfeit locus 1 family protein
MKRRFVVLLGPGLMTLAMLAVLTGLGTWQVHRLHWKQEILAQVARAEAAPPIALPESPAPYTKVKATGTLRDDLSATYGAEVRDTRRGPQLGAQLIVPMERPGKLPVLVDRGWVPLTRNMPIEQPEGEVTVQGFIRAPDHPGLFSAADDTATRQFFTLDPAKIGAALGLRKVAPFTLVEMGDAPPEHWPDPARHLPRPPNNHLSYAITWYGLAFALVVMFSLWARKALKT